MKIIMYPIINFIWFEISSYKLFFTLWWTIFLIWWTILNYKKWYNFKLVLLILSFSLIFGFLWARIFHVLLNLNYYKNNPQEIYNLSFEWQSIYWWIFFIILSIIILSKINKINYYEILDNCMPYFWIWLVFWRIWCLLAWCCFWKETTLPWWIKFPLFSEPHKHELINNPWHFFISTPIHPTQIYEMFTWLLIFLISMYLLKKKLNNWEVFFVTIIIYTVFRFINNFFRIDNPTYDAWSNFYPIFYIIIFIVSIVLLFRRKTKS